MIAPQARPRPRSDDGAWPPSRDGGATRGAGARASEGRIDPGAFGVLHRLARLLFCSLVVLSAGCKGPRGSAGTTLRADEVSQAPAPASTSTTLGPGDLIEVRVFEEADLSGPYRVAPGGTIDFPLCGKVQVQGLNTSAT